MSAPKLTAWYRIGRTHEEVPDYQYRVYRTVRGDAVEVYQYADTRDEAEALCREANAALRGES